MAKMKISTNKLQYIKLPIEEWKGGYNSCRNNMVKLSIGHTRLTHGHFMSRN